MPIQKYGYEWPDDTSDLQMHRAIYLESDDPQERYEHLKAGCQLWLPEQVGNQRGFLWSDWDEERAKAWCGVYTPRKHQSDIRVTWIGSGGSGKTTTAAMLLMWDFICAPESTSVRVATNTKECLEDRTWREIKRIWHLFPEGVMPGNYIESEMIIKSSAEGYIKGIAIKQGSVEAAIGSIKGAHSPRVIVVCDELDQMPMGVVEAIENASKACERFKFIGMGNPRKRYGNPLGEMATPKSGDWRAANLTMTQWETKHGLCQFFDGRKSPGIRQPERFSKFLITAEQIERTRAIHGEKSPIYWEQCIGFFAPEGISNAIIDEPMLHQYGLFDTPQVANRGQYGMFIDPSYSLGGDRCIAQPFLLAKIYCMPTEEEQALVKAQNNAAQAIMNAMRGMSAQRDALVLLPPEQIELELSETVSLTDSIARGVALIARRLNIAPTYIGMDCTGSQGAIADGVENAIGRGIMRVTFGGAAGKKPLDDIINDRHKKNRRGFINVRAEMYYAFRMFGRAGQIKGLDKETGIELTHTEWKSATPPYQVEDKDEVKKRIGMSPDKGDAVVGALHVARYRMNLMYLSAIAHKPSSQEQRYDKQDKWSMGEEGEPDYEAYQTAQ